MILAWDERVADWVAERIAEAPGGFGNCQALGIFSSSNMEIMAGVVLNDWTPSCGTIQLSGASENRAWMSRKVMNVVGEYVFGQLGAQMIYARQALDNTPALRSWKALGADIVTIPRLYGKDRDGAIITLTDDQWAASKFRRKNNG